MSQRKGLIKDTRSLDLIFSKLYVVFIVFFPLERVAKLIVLSEREPRSIRGKMDASLKMYNIYLRWKQRRLH